MTVVALLQLKPAISLKSFVIFHVAFLKLSSIKKVFSKTFFFAIYLFCFKIAVNLVIGCGHSQKRRWLVI